MKPNELHRVDRSSWIKRSLERDVRITVVSVHRGQHAFVQLPEVRVDLRGARARHEETESVLQFLRFHGLGLRAMGSEFKV